MPVLASKVPGSQGTSEGPIVAGFWNRVMVNVAELRNICRLPGEGDGSRMGVLKPQPRR
jgi:hypothetical protein